MNATEISIEHYLLGDPTDFVPVSQMVDLSKENSKTDQSAHRIIGDDVIS